MSAQAPKKKLTDRFINSLGPAKAGKRDQHMDTEVPNFGVRVTDKGAKTFILVARYPGGSVNRKTCVLNPSRRALGVYPHMTLAEARERARDWRALVAKGIDPKRLAADERREEMRRRAETFGDAAEQYIAQRLYDPKAPRRRARETERTIRKELISRWGDWPLKTVTKRDVVAMVQEIVGRGKPAMARNVLGTAKTFFRWCAVIDELDESPALYVDAEMLIGEKVPRTRVLKDVELYALWHAAGRLGHDDRFPAYPYRDFYRLLMLTGCRRSEVAGARWRELDLENRRWIIPAERFKLDAENLVPLTNDALEILNELPRFNHGDHLFSTTAGAKPINGFSKPKERLDQAMLDVMRERVETSGDDPDQVILEPFVVHDIRRTVRTRLSGLGINDTVAEMVIGHGRRGIQRVYDQHGYEGEMREALQLWAKALRAIIEREPKPGNVVRFSAA